MLIDHQWCDKEEREESKYKAQTETFAAGIKRLRVKLVPVDVIPVEGALEHPVLELQLCLLGLWHVEFETFCDFNLATVIDEVLDSLHVLRKNEGVANVLGNPVVFSSLQVVKDLLVVLLQPLCKVFL